MKKYPGRAAALAVLLAVLLVLTCAGCSRAEDPAEPEPQPTQDPGEIVLPDEPSDDWWRGPKFILGGTTLQLPLTLEQLQDLGFELAPYKGEEFWDIIPGWQAMFFMTHPDCGPSPVLEGVLTNPDGGETPPEQWPVQSVTVTLMHQLEDGGELLPPEIELAGGIGFGSCMQEVFDTYGLYNELIGNEEEGENTWWTVRYSADGRQYMNFRYAGDGLYLISLQLTLIPDSWTDGTAAPTLEQLEALEASGGFEELITPAP